MVRIIEIKKEDIPDFRRLFVQVFDEGFAYYPPQARTYILKSWTPAKIAAKLTTQNRLFVMAEENDVPVGYLIGKKYKSGLATILWLGVLKTAQGKGIGKSLVFAWEKWARERQAKRLRLSTTNPGNTAFYTKIGYKLSPKTWNNDWGMKQIVFLKKSTGR